ncbi:IPExxxVDY family protein [Flavobacterium sp. I-SCBP12n]|uniref:IPExxxVDY family protein n=1 Tax=Flavobacterium pygoscelis TaxID=2893176 RepID=A0A9X1XRR2_9FLAO|nr:IPExxxVDY family protein [Flavobacterium pygoscelis]MCK8140293.1 IPExxxVDY family protein [Flavobacterium pygoscelis]
MGIQKLDLGEFDEIDYYLIAIHTLLEDYRLAYFINQKLPINLSKSEEDIQINIKEGEINFSRFYYNDDDSNFTWNLIQNKNQVIQHKEENTQNLFSNVTMEVATKAYLLPELKKVDYFLKIENNEGPLDLSNIQLLLNTIDNVSTIFIVDKKQIKSKNNLIF